MATLYIDRGGAELELDHGALAVRVSGELDRRVPLLHLERLVITASTQLSTGLLAALAEAGVGVVVIRPRFQRAAVLTGTPRTDAARRLGQAAMILHSPTKDRWARHWVHAECMAMSRLLDSLADHSPAARAALWKARAQIVALSARLRLEALDAASARGVEGAAAAAYFEALQMLFAPALGFSGRNRRPPKDPVNACLSLVYTLLYAAAVEALTGVGLDPAAGFLHEPAPGRAGLACDLVEPFRAGADRTVIELFKNRILRKEHFHSGTEGCLLGKTGRRLFYETIEEPLQRLRARIRSAAWQLAKASDKAYDSISAVGGMTPCGRST
jgi:CRISPR-associated protein Cas1